MQGVEVFQLEMLQALGASQKTVMTTERVGS